MRAARLNSLAAIATGIATGIAAGALGLTSAGARVVVVRRDEAPTQRSLERAVLFELISPARRGSPDGVRAFVARRSLSRQRYAVMFGADHARRRYDNYQAWRDEVRVRAPDRFPAIVQQRGFVTVHAIDASTEASAQQLPIEQARLVRAALVSPAPLYVVALEDAQGERIYIGVFVYEGGRWWVAPLDP